MKKEITFKERRKEYYKSIVMQEFIKANLKKKIKNIYIYLYRKWIDYTNYKDVFQFINKQNKHIAKHEV